MTTKIQSLPTPDASVISGGNVAAHKFKRHFQYDKPRTAFNGAGDANYPVNPRDLKQWTPDQIRRAGSWSAHELDAEIDSKTLAYGWYPDWVGDMEAHEINDAVNAFYALTRNDPALDSPLWQIQLPR